MARRECNRQMFFSDFLMKSLSRKQGAGRNCNGWEWIFYWSKSIADWESDNARVSEATVQREFTRLNLLKTFLNKSFSWKHNDSGQKLFRRRGEILLLTKESDASGKMKGSDRWSNCEARMHWANYIYPLAKLNISQVDNVRVCRSWTEKY